MSKTFKSLTPSAPTMQMVMDALIDLERRVQESAEITDMVLEELQLRVIFLMNTIRITRQLQGGIAGPDGKVPSETKTAFQVYMEIGRAKLIEERAKHAASLQAAADAEAAQSNGATHAGEDTAAALAKAAGRVTH